MTREALAALLADLLARGHITPAEAERLLALHDAGEFVPSDLPAPQDDGNEWLLALLLVMLLTGGNATRPLSMARRRQARNLLRRGFEANTTALAIRVTTGAVGVQAWQGQMRAIVAVYSRQMAVAGAGALPGVRAQALVDARIAGQWPFLARFALLVEARQVAERPLSDRMIASRARQYGATAWGSYFLTQGQNAEYGMVDVWVSKDDNAVCRNCSPRHGQYFLAGQDAMPGWDCLGVCRCERVPEYNPQEYERLTGRRAA